MFVNKNGLGQSPEFRDQGVGGSNPLSPTNPFKDLTPILCILCGTRGSLVQPLAFCGLGAMGLQLPTITKPEIRSRLKILIFWDERDRRGTAA